MNKEYVNIGIYVSFLLFTPRIKLGITVVSWPHTASNSLDWPANVHHPFSEKTTEWVMTYLLAKSITRKANTVENNILRIVDCSSASKYKVLINCSRKCSKILGLWEPFKQNPPHSNVCILDSFIPVTHQKSAQHYWAELNENWLEEMKWLVGRDEIKVYWRIPFCESVVTFFKCYKNKEFF